MADGNLRQIFRAHLRGFDWLAVETGMTEGGVPDSNYCLGGVEGWIEMKQAKGWRIEVRPSQVGWAERRLRSGGLVYVAVRRRDDLRLYSGWDLRHLIGSRIDAIDSLGCWSGGPSRWDWDDVSRVLTSRFFCHQRVKVAS